MDIDRIDIDRFINDQNIELFRRRLASPVTVEVERKMLLRLLANEQSKCIELHKARTLSLVGEKHSEIR